MKFKTPFLTGFSTKLCGSAKRAWQASFRRKREKLLKDCLGSFAKQFSDLVPPELLESLSKTQRKRVFSNPLVFWAWLSQILEQNDSCTAALSRVQAWCIEKGLPVPSSETTGYCKARVRLSQEFITAVHQHVISEMERTVRSDDLYRGLTVKSVDGSSVQLMDTAENQSRFPQPSIQKEGCGFPEMKFVGVLNHAHGCWESCLTSPLSESDFVIGPGNKLVGDAGVGPVTHALAPSTTLPSAPPARGRFLRSVPPLRPRPRSGRASAGLFDPGPPPRPQPR